MHLQQDGGLAEFDATAIDARPTPPHQAWWRRWLPRVVMLAFALALISPGLAWRQFAWDYTEPGRYRFDINRNFTFGVKAIEQGYLNLYENDLRDNPSVERKLDYTPLRLAMFEGWATWIRRTDPTAERWRPEAAFSAPLMNAYTAGELLAAIAAMLIVVTWLRQCRAGDDLLRPEPPPWTGVIRAMAAFALLWFDPGMAIIAHGWPSPNMWVVPFYLWTALLCLWDFWFIAGLVMGIGMMLQGQQMFTAAVFILWPLMAGKPSRSFRWISGAALAFMGVTAGWMFTVRPDIEQPARYLNWTAVIWFVGAMFLLALPAVRQVSTWVKWKWWQALPAAAAFLVINLPAWQTRDGMVILVTLLLSSGAIAAMVWGRWSFKRYVLALSAALLLAACIPFFNASTAWWEIGFRYGAERFEWVGSNQANNLGAILRYGFDWGNIHEVCFTIPAKWLWRWPGEVMEVNNRQVLLTIYIAFFLVACFAIAWQWRKRGTGLLAALVLPWVLFFTLLPQMSPRYTVFVAGIGAICVGRSVGLAMLTLFFSALTVEQVALCMMNSRHFDGSIVHNALFNVDTRELFTHLNPGPAWGTLVAAGVFLAVSLAIPWRRRQISSSLNTGSSRTPAVRVSAITG